MYLSDVYSVSISSGKNLFSLFLLLKFRGIFRQKGSVSDGLFIPIETLSPLEYDSHSIIGELCTCTQLWMLLMFYRFVWLSRPRDYVEETGWLQNSKSLHGLVLALNYCEFHM